LGNQTSSRRGDISVYQWVLQSTTSALVVRR
jgi:hypothetical protein